MKRIGILANNELAIVLSNGCIYLLNNCEPLTPLLPPGTDLKIVACVCGVGVSTEYVEKEVYPHLDASGLLPTPQPQQAPRKKSKQPVVAPDPVAEAVAEGTIPIEGFAEVEGNPGE